MVIGMAFGWQRQFVCHSAGLLLAVQLGYLTKPFAEPFCWASAEPFCWASAERFC